jgi:peptidoglycan/xylan/chitin deacetylase (PgdA/CDA1 family)
MRSVTKTALAVLAGLLIVYGETRVEAIHAVPNPKSGGVTSSATINQAGEIVRGPLGKSQIALTFETGKSAECFEDLIGALDRAQVRSTFFVTGSWAERNRDCAAAISKHGHEVGNHCWNHIDLTKQPDEIVRQEILRADVLLTQLTGQSPRPRWRAPYGVRDERVLRIVRSLGYESIYWTIDSLDSADPPKSADFLIQRVIGQSDAELDGAIILLHVGSRATAEALPPIIANLQGRGFQLVTLSKLLESPSQKP